MTLVLNPKMIHAITTICDREGFDLTDYSGRGMFGARCLGITLPDVADAAVFFTSLCIEGYSDVAMALAPNTRTDNMGMDMIIYWERVSFDGFTESDDSEFGECDDCGDQYVIGSDDHDPETGICNRCIKTNPAHEGRMPIADDLRWDN